MGRLARGLCLWRHARPGPCSGETTLHGGRSGVAHKLRYGAFGRGKGNGIDKGTSAKLLAYHARHTGPRHLR